MSLAGAGRGTANIVVDRVAFVEVRSETGNNCFFSNVTTVFASVGSCGRRQGDLSGSWEPSLTLLSHLRAPNGKTAA